MNCFPLTASVEHCHTKSSSFSLSNKFHPSLVSPPHPLFPHSVSLPTRSERGYSHPGTRHDGPEHPLQPPVHPAARARLPPERLHPRQHSHPHLQPPAAAGHGPAGHPAGATPAPGLRPAWAPQGRPDPCLQEEVHQEGEKVELDGWRWRNDTWSDEKNATPPHTLVIRYLTALLSLMLATVSIMTANHFWPHGRCWRFCKRVCWRIWMCWRLFLVFITHVVLKVEYFSRNLRWWIILAGYGGGG